MEHLTIKVHWTGPYSIEEIDEQENGLYFVSGKRKYGRVEQIQYCGITEGRYLNRFANHHKLPLVTKDLEIWLGQIVYPTSFNRQHLETAESMIVYFWQPALNERKCYHPPKPTTLISHWFKKDGSPRFNQRSIYKYLHDVLCWDGELWRSGNLSVYADA